MLAKARVTGAGHRAAARPISPGDAAAEAVRAGVAAKADARAVKAEAPARDAVLNDEPPR
jgi:hypothetical protein